MSTLKHLFVYSLIYFLTGCGGGGGSSITSSITNDAHGIWVGTVTDSDSNVYQTTGIIKKNGQLRFISDDGEQTTGSASTDDDTFRASLTSYAPIGSVFNANGQNIISGTTTGNIVPQSRLTGTVKYNGATISTYDFTYDLAYERGASCNDLAGTFSSTEGTYTETYTFNPDCSITGSDTDGCTFSGLISIDDPAYNVYDVRLTVEACGIVNGTYRGFGALVDDVSADDTFAVQVESTDYIISGTIRRN